MAAYRAAPRAAASRRACGAPAPALAGARRAPPPPRSTPATPAAEPPIRRLRRRSPKTGHAAGSRIDRSTQCGQVDLVQCHDRHPRRVGGRSAGPDPRPAIRIRAPHRGALHRGGHRRPGRKRRRHRKPDDCANRARHQRGGPAHRAGGRPRGRHAAGSIRRATGAPQRQARCSWRSTRPKASITTSRWPIFISWAWASRIRSRPRTIRA